MEKLQLTIENSFSLIFIVIFSLKSILEHFFPMYGLAIHKTKEHTDSIHQIIYLITDFGIQEQY